MEQRRLKDVSDEEFPDVSEVYDPSSPKSKFRFKWWHALAFVVALFPYIAIPILFVLVRDNDGTTENNYYTEEVAATTSYSSTVPTSTVGKVVSFNAFGELQLGAGTSVYTDALGDKLTATCPKYLSMSSILPNQYLVSYVNGKTSDSTLQVLKFDSDKQANVLSTLSTSYNIYAVETLSQNDGTFVAICEDQSDTEETAYILVGTVDLDTGKVEIREKSKTTYARSYSVDPALVVLDEKTFALAYYNLETQSVNTRFGTVDLENGYAITLGTNTKFVDNKSNSTTFTAAALTAEKYMLIYSAPADEEGSYTQLNAMVATINRADASVSFTNASALENAHVAQYGLAATTLDNSTVVVAYVDAARDNSLVVQSIHFVAGGVKHFDADYNIYLKYIFYGGNYVAAAGTVAGNLVTGLMDLDVVKVSDANKDFAVLFSDLSNNAAITASTARVTAANEIVRTSPDFILRASYDLNSFHAWGAASTGNSSYLSSQTAFLSLLSDSSCATTSSAQLSLLEVKPAPAGVTAYQSDNQNIVSVAVFGAVNNGLSGLLPGREYFASTAGDLIAGDAYIGRAQSSNDVAGGAGYVYDAEKKVYVTYASRVGIATSSKSLFITNN